MVHGGRLAGPVICLLVALLLVAATFFQPPFVGSAERHSSDVAESAALAYAALRVINATLSTAKEAEVSVPIVGGLGAKPGMILDPIDETVARVSDVLFLLMAVTAVLKFAIGPIATLGAATSAAGFVGLSLVRCFPRLESARVLAQRLAVLGLVLALVLPASFAAGGWFGREITQDRLDAAYQTLRAAGGEDDLAADPAAAGGASSGASWWNFWSETGEADRAEGEGQGWLGAIEELAGRAETILTSSLDIIAIYLMRLFVFPALVLVILTIVVRQTLLLLSGRPVR